MKKINYALAIDESWRQPVANPNAITEFEKDSEQRCHFLKTKYPSLWKGIVKLFHGAKPEINDVYEITTPSEKKIYFIDEPRHGHYLSEFGHYLGEEDEGLKDTNLNRELANWSLAGKACTRKSILNI